MAPRIDTNHRPKTALDCPTGDTSPECQLESQPHLANRTDVYFKAGPKPKGPSVGTGTASGDRSEKFIEEQKFIIRSRPEQLIPVKIPEETFRIPDDIKSFLAKNGRSIDIGLPVGSATIPFTEILVDRQTLEASQIKIIVDALANEYRYEAIRVKGKSTDDVFTAVLEFIDQNNKAHLEMDWLARLKALNGILSHPFINNPLTFAVEQDPAGPKPIHFDTALIDARTAAISSALYQNYERIAGALKALDPTGESTDEDIVNVRVVFMAGMKDPSIRILVKPDKFRKDPAFRNKKIAEAKDQTKAFAHTLPFLQRDNLTADECIIAFSWHRFLTKTYEGKKVKFLGKEEQAKVSAEERTLRDFRSMHGGVVKELKDNWYQPPSPPAVAPPFPNVAIFSETSPYAIPCPPADKTQVANVKVENDQIHFRVSECESGNGSIDVGATTNHDEEGNTWSPWKVEIKGVRYPADFPHNNNETELLLIPGSQKKFDVIPTPAGLATLWADLFTEDDYRKVQQAQAVLAALGTTTALKLLKAKLEELKEDYSKKLILVKRGFETLAGPEVNKFLVVMLQSEQDVIFGVIDLLGKKKVREAIPVLRSIYSNETESSIRRYSVAEAVVAITDNKGNDAKKAKQVLKDINDKIAAKKEQAEFEVLLLQIEDPATQPINAVELMQKGLERFPKRAETFLVHILLNSPLPAVSLNAAKILGNKKFKGAIPHLEEVHLDESKNGLLREAAAQAVISIKEAKSKEGVKAQASLKDVKEKRRLQIEKERQQGIALQSEQPAPAPDSVPTPVVTDGGTPDAGKATDAGTPPQAADGGTPDAGAPDAGTPDAGGTPSADAGPPPPEPDLTSPVHTPPKPIEWEPLIADLLGEDSKKVEEAQKKLAEALDSDVDQLPNKIADPKISDDKKPLFFQRAFEKISSDKGKKSAIMILKNANLPHSIRMEAGNWLVRNKVKDRDSNRAFVSIATDKHADFSFRIWAAKSVGSSERVLAELKRQKSDFDKAEARKKYEREEEQNIKEAETLYKTWKGDTIVEDANTQRAHEILEEKLKNQPQEIAALVLRKIFKDAAIKSERREAAVQYARAHGMGNIIPSPADAGTAHEAADAGTTDATTGGADAGKALDAGSPHDAGKAPDAGTTHQAADAGTPPDAGKASDAGAPSEPPIADLTDGGTPPVPPPPPSLDDLVVDLVSGDRNKVKSAQAQRAKLSRADRKEVDKKVAEIDKKRKAEAQAKIKADTQARRDAAKAERQRKINERKAADAARKAEAQRKAEKARKAQEAEATEQAEEAARLATEKTKARAKAKAEAKIDVYRIRIRDGGTQLAVQSLAKQKTETATETKLTHTYTFGSDISPSSPKTKVIFEAKWNGNALGPWSYHVEGPKQKPQELTDSKQVIIYQDKSGAWVIKPLTNPDKEVAIIGTELLKPKTPVTNAPQLQRAVPENDGMTVTLQKLCETMELSAETYAVGTQYTCGKDKDKDIFTLANHLNNTNFVLIGGYLLNEPEWRLETSSFSKPVDGDTVDSFRRLAQAIHTAEPTNPKYFLINDDTTTLITEVFPKLPSTVHFIGSEPSVNGNEATYTQSTVSKVDIKTSDKDQTATATIGDQTVTFTRTINIADDKKITVEPWQMVIGTQPAEEVASGTTELFIFQNKAYRDENTLKSAAKDDFAKRKREQKAGLRTTSPLKVSLRVDIGQTTISSEVPPAIPSNITDPEERAATAQAAKLSGQKHEKSTEWPFSASATATYPLVGNRLGVYAEGQLGSTKAVALGANLNLNENFSLHAGLLQAGHNSTTGGFATFGLPVVGGCLEGSRYQACFDYRHFSTERPTETGQRTDALGTLGLSIGVTGDLTDIAGLVRGGSHFLGTDRLTIHIEEKSTK